MSKKKLSFTIGSDPEFFLANRVGGKFISAIGNIKGTKHEPYMLKSGGGLHHDNVAIEFSTKPHLNVDDFIKHIGNILKDITAEIPKDLQILNMPSANFTDDQLQSDAAKEFGCDPDFDAWEIAINEKPYIEDQTLRSCGGHIHVGFVDNSGNDFLLDSMGKIETVRVMDALHGIVSVILDGSEAATKRRQLYGKAGCHRPTGYGFEYRVLSNFWFKSPQLVMLMSSLTEDALKIKRNKEDEKLIMAIGKDNILNAINNGDVKLADSIWFSTCTGMISEESYDYFITCLDNINNYDFHKEWAIGA